MTKTIDEMVAVMIAARDGKKIQYLPIRNSNGFPITDEQWYDSKETTINWNWHCFDYRVKPEPWRIYVNEYKTGLSTYLHFDSVSAGMIGTKAFDFVRVVTFIEEVQ